MTPPGPSPSPGVIATYRFETSRVSPDQFAEAIAVGQTLGTSHPPTDRCREYLAQVLSVEVLGEGAAGRIARARIGFPLATVNSDIGVLLTVLFGKISMAGAIRLEEIEVTPELIKAYGGGPRHGLHGIRQQCAVPPNNPLLMSIFKPCLGLSAEALGDMYATQCRAGIDLVKDDEVLSDPEFDTARRRLTACLQAGQTVLAQGAAEKLPVYAMLLSGPAHTLLERANTLVADGATALLFNYLSYGLPLLQALRQTVPVPIVAHPALGGAFYGSPAHGIAPAVLFGTLPRLAGADAVLFPSPYGSVALPQQQALAVASALRDLNPRAGHFLSAAPVPSAGITHTMVGQILNDFGPDVIINAGTGIHDHAEGASAGVQAFRTEIRNYSF